MNKIRLSVNSLTAAYGTERVFSDVTFDVSGGELVSIMGASGAGKSTLLRVLCGLMEPVAGRVEIDGVSVIEDGGQRIPVEQRRVGLMFQDFALFPHLSVEDNVGFGIRDSADRESRVESLLAAVDLVGFGKRDIRSLSGGQKQRVALIRALAPRPALLLLDEPLANLDAEIRRPIAEVLKAMIEREGTAAIMVTHDRSEALGLSDRVGVLERVGDEPPQLVQLDTPETLFWSPLTRGVARLTGESIICDCYANGRMGETVFGDVTLPAEYSGKVSVMVRPQSLRWTATFAGGFRVRQTYFVGPGYHVEVESVSGLRFMLNDVINPPAIDTELNIETTKPVVVLS